MINSNEHKYVYIKSKTVPEINLIQEYSLFSIDIIDIILQASIYPY
jgi:hypothetical protein